ncbi:A-kinase anchor protein SPHKAP [Bombina bombina]|uniref:A-kinase anchor protein SPHKAP n=1 Tax=Bombina bombina TaxID=8345 RepID=UPI00235AC68F|nr:A-kinase anchor protein SPHKAP [Bombina bombina]
MLKTAKAFSAVEKLMETLGSIDPSALCGSLDNYGSSGGSSIMDTSTSNLGSSITACKKVLCTNRPAESLDYWLQNPKNLCQIVLAEEKSEAHCTSICFVNLSVTNKDPSQEDLQKKLVDVSPDLPKLMSSVKAQELKENEIVLLSGLSTGRLCHGTESPQAPWSGEVCLLQCAKTSSESTSCCIILELNKFLLGLELVQENRLLPSSSPLRAEDDTNCSVSSIEEDFLTASEQLEEDSDEENYRIDSSDNNKKIRQKGDENIESKKSKVTLARKAEHLRRGQAVAENYEIQVETTGVESNSEKHLQGTELGYHSHLRRSSLGKIAYESKQCIVEVDKSFTEMCKIQDKESQEKNDTTETSDDPATTGQYATNLAECVLQDAFIRLSQSESTFTKEAAVSISANNSLLSEAVSKDVPVASRLWNELPKIVIVQSPDSYDNPTDWTEESHWPVQESFQNVSKPWQEEDKSLGHTQSTLEVALACAASVIGTISSPHTAERIKMEQEGCLQMVENVTSEQHLTEIPGFQGICLKSEYSVPSALCGMTQVASAVAVCGLGEQKQISHPTTSSGLLAVADASAAITLHCSIALGSSMEKLKESIAKVLLKEASVVLTSPSAYKNVGEFIECINERIIDSVSSSKLAQVEDVVTDDLAHNLSDAILRHSAEEANRRLDRTDNQNSTKSQSAFVAATTNLLFNVMHFTCQKMRDLALSGELPYDYQDENNRSTDSGSGESQLDDLTDLTLSPQSLVKWNGNQIFNTSTELKHKSNVKNLSQIEFTEGSAFATDLCCSNISETPLHLRTTCSKQQKKRESYRLHHNEYKTSPARESSLTSDDCKSIFQSQGSMELGVNSGSQEKLIYEAHLSKDFPMNLSSLSSYMLHPTQAVVPVKLLANNYFLTDFADDLAETVVSMATEMAAICLDNSCGKQPWFCAWKNGSEFLVTPSRTLKRKKEAASGGAVVRRHRPPRLSEIKKKTDEHPELKERLMNRVVDESINLEDAPDSVSSFANEVASRIMNLTESSVADALWQGQNISRNRLHCERWNRGKASSYESIPEEDSDTKNLINTLGPGNLLGQPCSRTSSVSKQSSCESITDEFSRFMVNQMENEGREFELLLDYYAGKNANNIINCAMQQISRRNSHLNVKTSCLSKQSSTESITEEFYRYMLKEIDKENKDISSRKTAEWTNSLMPPNHRVPFCFRQSSMPCNKTSSARLTVNTPIKANSLDGFARSNSRDFLQLQPVSAISSSNLCKSDSCLYQRCHTDQATDMLIHETWSSSIEALMRKNKIITCSSEEGDVDISPNGSPAHVDSYANRLAADIVNSGKSLVVLNQDSFDSKNKGSFNNKSTTKSQCKATARQELKSESLNKPVLQHGLSSAPRKVPLIQIETEQREEIKKLDKENTINMTLPEDNECSNQDKEVNVSTARVRTVQRRSWHDPDISSPEEKTRSVLITPLSSSEDSTGSWSHLVNEDENPEDTSSFLQLSERSMSNSNSSTISSVGGVDLEIYQEVISPAMTADRKEEEKHLTKETQENPDECTSGLSVGTISCQQEVSIINIDLEPDCTDSELRITLQWIAASELGIPAVYFKKLQQHKIKKFLEVTRLVQAKSWKVGDIFSALILHRKIQEQGEEKLHSFFDWLLELG